jgi:hypothetical protein
MNSAPSGTGGLAGFAAFPGALSAAPAFSRTPFSSESVGRIASMEPFVLEVGGWQGSKIHTRALLRHSSVLAPRRDDEARSASAST